MRISSSVCFFAVVVCVVLVAAGRVSANAPFDKNYVNARLSCYEQQSIVRAGGDDVRRVALVREARTLTRILDATDQRLKRHVNGTIAEKRHVLGRAVRDFLLAKQTTRDRLRQLVGARALASAAIREACVVRPVADQNEVPPTMRAKAKNLVDSKRSALLFHADRIHGRLTHAYRLRDTGRARFWEKLRATDENLHLFFGDPERYERRLSFIKSNGDRSQAYVEKAVKRAREHVEKQAKVERDCVNGASTIAELVACNV